jgi:twinkle protein
MNKTDLACWTCSGRTSAAYYEDPTPHLYCFRCGEFEWNEDFALEYSMTLEKETTTKSREAQDVPKKSLKRGISQENKERKIKKEIVEKFSVEKLFSPDNKTPWAWMYPYHNKRGEFIAQKIKGLSKKDDMFIHGNFADAVLFGQQLFPAGGKYITITEGEEDALACYQILKEHLGSKNIEPCVVSIPTGAVSASNSLKKNWEYISSFENIILCFDGDEPGQKAALKCADLFPFQTVKIVKFSEPERLKDACDYLKNDRQKEFVNMWFNAERFRPRGILSFRDLWDDMVNEKKQICVPYPWDSLNKKLHGQRTGEFVVIKAPPKTGKTQVLRELAYSVRTTSDYNVGVISLEETKKRIGIGLCSLHLNRNLQHPDYAPETNAELVELLKEPFEFLSSDDRIMIFDPEDYRTAENLINKITYLAKAHDCRFIYFDHISMLAYTSDDENERRFIDKLTSDLKSLTNTLDIHICAVTHVNDDGQTRGSRAPVQLCDALINLERDRFNEDENLANTVQVIVEENRLTGESGGGCFLLYDKETSRLTEVDIDLASIERQQVKTNLKFAEDK